MPLHVDNRPKTLDEMKGIGNKPTVDSLKSIFERQSDYPHAILFQGPRGCGKTTLARITASFLHGKPYNEVGPDFVQIDGGDVNAEAVRKLKEQVRFRPMMSKARVWLIEEAHMVGAGGASEKNIPQNNLLTLTEEAPKHAYFIFATTDPQRLVSTIRSRFTTFEVVALKDSEIVELLQDVLKKEEVTDILEDILKKIAYEVDGCPRDALKILDQIIDMDLNQMESAINAFAYSDKQMLDFYKAIITKQSWDRIRLILKQLDLSNPEQIRRQLVGLLGKEILKKNDPDIALVYDCFKMPFYNNGKNDFYFAAHRAVIELM